MSKTNIYIGTSGWSFDWDSYVEESIPKNQRLEKLSTYFNAVEVNYSFYRLPQAKSIKRWRKQTADDFQFAMKLSRFITHSKRLKSVKTPVKKFLSRYAHLDDKAGPILVELPPNFEVDHTLLDTFICTVEEARKDLKLNPVKLAFEFRNPTWFTDVETTAKILASHKAGLVFAHSSKYPYPTCESVTANSFVYFRLHGPKELFASEYGRRRLYKWRDQIKNLVQDYDVYVFFNNDKHAYAAKDALTLKQMLQI